MSIYVDLHVLQTVPPSCVNRDDTGSPKTAVYGGATRARVSSQAWKHAMRDMFKNELFASEELGYRTKNVIEMVIAEGRKLGSELDPKKVEKALTDAGLKFKDQKCEALFFFSVRQASAIAELVINEAEEKDEYKKALKKALQENPSVDIALFGRMVASDPTMNCDAAAQVAHAISTHAVHNEYDYFTAVDDLQAEDNAGAGHLGTVEFNSSTLYRYANVNVSELLSTLGKENMAAVVAKFAKAFVYSMPTGKENTFANRTLPDAVYVTVRKDQPINLSNAFETPVRSNGNGFAIPSEKALVKQAQTVYARFADAPEYAFCVGDELKAIATELPMKELLTALAQSISEILE